MVDFTVSKIQNRRGKRRDLPQPLDPGEFGLCIDSKQLFIGADVSEDGCPEYYRTVVLDNVENAQNIGQSLLDQRVINITTPYVTFNILSGNSDVSFDIVAESGDTLIDIFGEDPAEHDDTGGSYGPFGSNTNTAINVFVDGNQLIEGTDYTYDGVNHIITFTTAPAQTNPAVIEITYYQLDFIEPVLQAFRPAPQTQILNIEYDTQSGYVTLSFPASDWSIGQITAYRNGLDSFQSTPGTNMIRSQTFSVGTFDDTLCLEAESHEQALDIIELLNDLYYNQFPQSIPGAFARLKANILIMTEYNNYYYDQLYSTTYEYDLAPNALASFDSMDNALPFEWDIDQPNGDASNTLTIEYSVYLDSVVSQTGTLTVTANDWNGASLNDDASVDQIGSAQIDFDAIVSGNTVEIRYRHDFSNTVKFRAIVRRWHGA